MTGGSPISQDHIATFKKDGVVCLRSVIDPAWIDRLRRADDAIVANPRPRALRGASGDAGRFIVQGGAGTLASDIQSFAASTQARQIAAELMDSRDVTPFNDVVFVKEPGAGATEWHNDYSYMALSGTQICTIWVALDHVTAETGAMYFVRGSHRKQKLYRPILLGSGRERGVMERRDPVPDIWACADADDLVSFDLQPGDCTIHHAWTLHGTKANESQTEARRGIAFRYTGDDVRPLASQYGVRQAPER